MTTNTPPLPNVSVEHVLELLEAMSPPQDEIDLSTLDGFLLGVAVQPQGITPQMWQPYVWNLDDGAAWPEQSEHYMGLNRSQGNDLLQALSARLRTLRLALRQRQWFDPWIFGQDNEVDEEFTPSNAVEPWVMGFSLAINHFGGLLRAGHQQEDMHHALALMFQHLDPDDVELEPEIVEQLQSLEGGETLEDAIEDLVCASLLLADVAKIPRALTNAQSAQRPHANKRKTRR